MWSPWQTGDVTPTLIPGSNDVIGGAASVVLGGPPLYGEESTIGDANLVTEAALAQADVIANLAAATQFAKDARTIHVEARKQPDNTSL
ncbi:MAG TPA: hypothetical protein VN738_09015, partial [Acidothermaceae bacterium]|nr:hypothetical protein [Acidothermaceae bacterium]